MLMLLMFSNVVEELVAKVKVCAACIEAMVKELPAHNNPQGGHDKYDNEKYVLDDRSTEFMVERDGGQCCPCTGRITDCVRQW